MTAHSPQKSIFSPPQRAWRPSKDRQDITAPPAKVEKLCRSFRRRRRGAAVVEFALVAPIFILLVFGMIEFGRMVMVQQVITNASREGARQAVIDGNTAAAIKKTVNSYLRSAGISEATINLSPDPPSRAEYGDPVTVTVDVAFSEVSWLFSPMYLKGANLSSTATMRRESDRD